jgi:large repetitive protein
MPKLVSSVSAVPTDRRSPRHRRAVLLAGVMAAVAAALPAQVPPGLQFAELGKRHLPPDSDQTQAVAYGDVDGDGDLDLVVGNVGRSRLYLNHGTGTFTDATASRMPAGSYATTSVALGDVDGDGDLDLVIGNVQQQTRLYLNDGTGTFTDATASRMPVDGDLTFSVALGDIDGDGDLDLVIGNYGQQNRLCLNNGAGTFTDVTASRMPVDSDRTASLAFGDVDADGDLDLVIGNGGLLGQQNRLYLNSGTGLFTDATAGRMPVRSSDTQSLALGDVDGDGDLDMVFGDVGFSGQQNRLYLNSGTGTFTDATASRMPVDSDMTFALALGDVDGDGDLDLLIGNYGQQNRLYRNDGTGTFTDATANRMPVDRDQTLGAALGDVDGDGDLDLMLGNWQQQNRLYLNNGTGTFTDATASRMPVDNDPTTSLALGDVDGDGDLDLVLGNWQQPNRLYLNDGAGTFTDATAFRMPVDSDRTTALALGDADGDGDLDLVIGNDGQDRLYLNNGTGTFTDATASRMPVDIDSTTSVALGSVDGDGDLDLVIGNGGQSRLYLNNGLGTFTDATASRMPAGNYATRSVALGDFDGDGDLDLVIGSYGQQNRLYRNDGTGTFTDVTASQMPVDSDRTYALVFGDVDGDTDLDLVIGNDGQDRLYRNDGTGTFTDATVSRMPVDNDRTSSLALGDVDGDGDLDLVFGNYGQQNRLYRNNGQGTFTDATVSRMPVDSDRTLSVALGSVDGDGDLDLVIGSFGQRNRLHTNLHHQLDARYLLRPGQPFALDVYSRYGPPSQFDVAVAFLSTTRLGIPVPPFGILGIDPMVSLPPVVIPPLTGSGTVTWLVPNTPAFAGIEIFAQAAILHVPIELRLSNVTADVLIR